MFAWTASRTDDDDGVICSGDTLGGGVGVASSLVSGVSRDCGLVPAFGVGLTDGSVFADSVEPDCLSTK